MAKKLAHVNIFKFRVIVDTEENVFRVIEIETDATFDDLHRAILDAFDFEVGEMASFYMSSETWEKGLEIPLTEMGSEVKLSMKSTKLEDMAKHPADKILYVYDFLKMWIFYVELIEVKKDIPSTLYPRVALVYGDAPSQDSKEMDLFGIEFSEAEFNAMHGSTDDAKEEDDMFKEENEFLNADEFSRSYSDGEDI